MGGPNLKGHAAHLAKPALEARLPCPSLVQSANAATTTAPPTLLSSFRTYHCPHDPAALQNREYEASWEQGLKIGDKESGLYRGGR